MNGENMETKFGNACINKMGYYVISSTGKYHNKLLHRLLYEDANNLTLLSTTIVHHKDGNKLNNSLDNLELMTKSEHNRIHHKNKKNSVETIHKMRISKLGKNNPNYGTGSSGYYRVYTVKRPKNKISWVYEYPNNGKKKELKEVICLN